MNTLTPPPTPRTKTLFVCTMHAGFPHQTAAATAVAAGAVFSGAFPAAADGPYTLPDLPYPYEALEPYIDAATMKVYWLWF